MSARNRVYKLDQSTPKGLFQAKLYRLFKSLDYVTDDQFAGIDPHSLSEGLDKIYFDIKASKDDSIVKGVKRVVRATGISDLSKEEVLAAFPEARAVGDHAVEEVLAANAVEEVVSILVKISPDEQLKAIAKLRKTSIPQTFIDNVETELFDMNFD